MGFQATQTAEFGGHVRFASGPRDLRTVTITMSSWACETGEWNLGTCVTTAGASFSHPVTVTIYNVATGPAVGSVIATRTLDVTVPFRPSADETCSDVRQWKDSAGNCFSGIAFNVNFDFSGVVVPDEVIYGVAFNTQTWGYAPIGTAGPYDALNVGVTDGAVAPYVGEDVDPNGVFRAMGATPTFVAQTGWGAWTVAARFDSAPPAPLTADDCKNGGYAAFGYKNQGQCVSSIKANENAGR